MFRFFVIALLLAGCNSVYVKPNTLDTSEVIYVDRGGYTMQHAIKQRFEKRGYNVTVGHKHSSINTTYIESSDSTSVLSTSDVGRARYVVQISETTAKFRPIWCSMNGFWWWRFNVSIADNTTGQEILSWSGRGCQNSSLRKLDKILDKMEMDKK